MTSSHFEGKQRLPKRSVVVGLDASPRRQIVKVRNDSSPVVFTSTAIKSRVHNRIRSHDHETGHAIHITQVILIVACESACPRSQGRSVMTAICKGRLPEVGKQMDRSYTLTLLAPHPRIHRSGVLGKLLLLYSNMIFSPSGGSSCETTSNKSRERLLNGFV